jgi:hypothetical protein
MKTRTINQSLAVKASSNQVAYAGPKYTYTLPVNTEEEAKQFLLARAASYAVRPFEIARHKKNPAEFKPLTVVEMIASAAQIVLAERVKRKLTKQELEARKANKALNAIIEQADKLKAKGKDETYIAEFLKMMDADEATVELVLEEVFGEEENEG